MRVFCDTKQLASATNGAKVNVIMQLVADPKSVKVNKTAGTGMEIEWKDGHRSSYSFVFLRDACPCALCQEERDKDGREPGDPARKRQWMRERCSIG